MTYSMQLKGALNICEFFCKQREDGLKDARGFFSGESSGEGDAAAGAVCKSRQGTEARVSIS